MPQGWDSGDNNVLRRLGLIDSPSATDGAATPNDGSMPATPPTTAVGQLAAAARGLMRQGSGMGAFPRL
jgi:hypothetical protein